MTENGYYYLTLSGPGYNNLDNHSKFEGKWEKLSIKDVLTIKPDFTWERSKEIDFGFYLKWNGTYSYTDDLVVFSLTEQGYSGLYFSGISETVIPYYGLMYGPIIDTHTMNEPMQGLISGLISGSVSGMINGIISGTASGIASGGKNETVEGLISGIFTNFITCEVNDEATGIASGLISGVVDDIGNGIGRGIAKDTKISGILTGNVHTILLNNFVTGVGLAENVMAAINPTNFSISGLIEDTVDNVFISGFVNKTVNNVLISGNAYGAANDIIVTCMASGTVNNAPVIGIIDGTVNGILISGLIKQAVNNVFISGMASGIINNVPISGMVSGTVNNAVINGSISGKVDNIQISGVIAGNTSNVNIMGKVSGIVDKVSISGIVNGIIPGFTFSDTITGIVYGQIRVKLSDLIDNESVIIDSFKTNLYSSISGYIGTNEETYFGTTVSEIKKMISGAIEDVIDYNLINDIISPIYLSKSSIVDVTDKILFDAIIYNGNYISGNSINGVSIDPLRNTIITKISEILINILSNISIQKIVYDTVDSYEISGAISGYISGILSGMVSNEIGNIAAGYASGYANGLISGVVINDVFCNISGLITGKVFDTISGMGYGMASIVAYAPGIGDVVIQKKILNTFLDDSFSDFTNFYKISGANEVTSGIDIINPGGRGQLLNAIIVNTIRPTNIIYDVGVYSGYISGNYEYHDYMNSKFKNVQAVSGNQSEFAPYSDNYGGIGGNVIQNSFDFYEKNIPENGFVRLIYADPDIIGLRTLEITCSGLEVLPDTTAAISGNAIINTMLTENEANVYYRILERNRDLDLEKSVLNGKPLSEYNVKYEYIASVFNNQSYNDREQLILNKYPDNELYISKLDNHRRILSFKTPFRSENVDNQTVIPLDLKTTNRKFYFAVARDNNIDTVKIDGILFHPDDQDKDGLYRKYRQRDDNGNVILDDNGDPIYNGYEFYAGQPYEIEVTFKDEADSLMKELIVHYLSDCLEENSISRSNNYKQTINPFKMPQRDVLLFLKTERCYLLNIFRSEDSSHINEILHENESELPIFKRHFWDDKIEIAVSFSSKFYEIDREDLKNQLSDIDDIRYNDSERLYEPNVGYDISIPETIKFLMPARNVTLYIKEKDYRQKLKIRSFNKKTDDNDVTNDNEPNHFFEISVNGETPNRLLSEEPEYEFMVRDPITIKVYFYYDDNNYYELDNEFITTQLMAFNKLNGKEYVEKRADSDNNILNGYDSPYQEINFAMPNQDLVLIIKEISTRKKLVIKPDPYQFNNETRKINGIIYNNIFYNFLSNIPVTIEAVPEQVIDIYVSFSDICMHLDSLFLYSQEPLSMKIEEAGEYSDILEPSQYPLYGDINDKKELYQHFRFKMTKDDLTLSLKWIERLFMIEYDIQASFFNSTTIKDSNRVINLYEPPKEKQVTMRQSIFPHYTYPVVGNDITGINYYDPPYNTIMFRRNTIDIISKLKPYMKLKGTTCYLKIGNNKIPFEVNDQYSVINYPSDPNRVHPYSDKLNVIWDEPALNISFPMPKDNVKITLNIGLKIEQEITIKDYGQGEFFLDAGYYDIEVRAADGGDGNSKASIGQRWSITNLLFKEPFTLTYMLGQVGQNGGGWRGNHGGGGGGGAGGGSSLLIFDTLFLNPNDNNTYDAVYCTGGWGTRGRSGDGVTPGAGGSAGYGGGGTVENDPENNGNGGNGGDGGSGPFYGTAGSGGAGGIGWSRKNIKNKKVIWKLGNSGITRTTANADGYLYIKYTKEYTEQD